MQLIRALFCLLIASTALAAGPFRTGGPSTIDNDASCDLSLMPAATLLLPYFEVDYKSAAGTNETTIFTVTNTSHLPQIARVTLWTNLAYPVFTFNVYLTGYDVQSINLYDVIARGQIAPEDGTGSDVSPVGELSGTTATADFDNPVIDERTCTDLPVQMNAAFISRMKSAFTTGKVAECSTVAIPTRNAAGYATIDVVGRCDSTMPDDPMYFTRDIRFDNVLMGDYHQINGDEDLAQGGTMVHIRAVPEGGTPLSRAEDPAFDVEIPRTFYSAYQDPAHPRLDARQPLPALFAARWIGGGGVNDLATFFKIWREPRANAETCRAYRENDLDVRDAVRFDEEENPEVVAFDCEGLCRADLPQSTTGAVAGWLYLNLDDTARDDIARQAWVVVSMRAQNRFSTDTDALALGNGCSTPLASSATFGNVHIGPAPNKRRAP